MQTLRHLAHILLAVRGACVVQTVHLQNVQIHCHPQQNWYFQTLILNSTVIGSLSLCTSNSMQIGICYYVYNFDQEFAFEQPKFQQHL